MTHSDTMLKSDVGFTWFVNSLHPRLGFPPFYLIPYDSVYMFIYTKEWGIPLHTNPMWDKTIRSFIIPNIHHIQCLKFVRSRPHPCGNTRRYELSGPRFEAPCGGAGALLEKNK